MNQKKNFHIGPRFIVSGQSAQTRYIVIEPHCHCESTILNGLNKFESFNNLFSSKLKIIIRHKKIFKSKSSLISIVYLPEYLTCTPLPRYIC